MQVSRSLLMAASVFLMTCASPTSAQNGVGDFRATAAQAKADLAANPLLALDRASAAERLAMQLPASPVQGRALATARWLEGDANVRLDRIDRAAPLIESARSVAHRSARNTKLEGDILLSSGTIHGQRGEPALALRDFQRAFQIFLLIKDARARAIALLCIGQLYGDANDFASALKYFDQALDAYQLDPSLLLSIDNNRAVALLELRRYSEAESGSRSALALARKMNNRLLVARIIGNIANVRLKTGDVAGADHLIRAALARTTGRDAAVSRLSLIAWAARIALRRHDLHQAEQLIRERFAGLDLATTSVQLREAHQTAFEVYRALGDTILALDHLMALKRLDDQSTRLATSANIALAAARFDFANQELRIQTLRNEELRRNVAFEQAHARTARNIFVGVALMTVAIIAMLAFGLVTIRRSRNRERAANADLAVTNTALAKALAAKTEFLATTSHEIRTPLNGILGMTQVMLADAHLRPDVRDRIGVVHGAGITMKALVDDILDVAKMETGNLTVESAPFDLKETLLDAARLWEQQATAKGVTFALDLGQCPALIQGDVARVRQVVFNLLSNALKFTAEGQVSLSGACAGQTYSITVADSGIGIAADKCEQIFESFRQADAGTTRRFGGTGLGLAICRNLARAMGGDVTVASEPGRGSRFTVTLPLVDAAPAPTADAEPVSAEEVVLIVDGNPITRAMFKTLVEPHAGRVLVAATLADAARRLAEGGIARVLIDGGTVAGDDGGAAALTALAAAAGADATTALLWAGALPAEVADAGIDRILPKPISGTALVSTLFASDARRKADGALVPRAA